VTAGRDQHPHAWGLMRVPAKFGLAGGTQGNNCYQPGGRRLLSESLPQWFESTYQSSSVLVELKDHQKG